MRGTLLALALIALLLAADVALAADPPPINWIRQLGTSSHDISRGLALDGSAYCYVGGDTKGSLHGSNAGGQDAFLIKYSTAGDLLWKRQFGTSSDDYVTGVDVDALGNSYISGYRYGSLGGQNLGERDAFVAKYDSTGAPLWTRQFGTCVREETRGLAVSDTGDCYISGYTHGDLGAANAGAQGAFVTKFDAAGELLWTRQLGGNGTDVATAVAVDSAGDCYAVGRTYVSLGGPVIGNSDIFLVKYDGNGNALWKQQLGTPMLDMPWGLAVDTLGCCYISGETEGHFGGTNTDYKLNPFVCKCDQSGNLVWADLLSNYFDTYCTGVAVDSEGNSYITGHAEHSLLGPKLGGTDVFLAKYDALGNRLWGSQLGTSQWEMSYGVAVGEDDTVYFTGWTGGDLGGPNAGEGDVFLISIPEPATLSLLTVGALTLLRRRRKSRR